MGSLLLVFFGGGLGSICRFGLSSGIGTLFGKHFPYGILACNLIGCFVIGVLAAYFAKTHMIDHIVTPHLKALFITGFLGGFTTFSSFSLDTLYLFHSGQWQKAILYMVVTLMLSILAVFAGFHLIHEAGHQITAR